MIKVENLSYSYSGRSYAVKDVSFSIKNGEIFGLLGPNGAGKTTTQNLMIGLLPLQEGEVFYDELSIKRSKSAFFNSIGVSFEQPNLYGKLTGYENLKYFAGLFDVATENPFELLKKVGLADVAHKRVNAYSKGMKQRLVFARALINNPKRLFFDEPLSGLDPNTASFIKEIIREQKEAGKTILLTTHNMFVAEELCDTVAFINDGRIVALDSPRNLKLKYGQNSVRVEHREKGKLKTDIFFLENEKDRENFINLIKTKNIEIIHSQEATLEQVFIKLTGRGLS
jgi:fluoroquinolone transport system ATP-binding protein